MDIIQVILQASFNKSHPKCAGLVLVVFICVSVLATNQRTTPETPLEKAGLKPVFTENFTAGKLDAMRYEPAYGSKEQFNAYIQPGAIFMGQKDATENTEQQVNYYPKSNEPAVSTIEFDAWPTTLRESRALVRPRRFRDGVHVRIGQPGEKTQVVFRNEPGGYKIVDYETLTGPNRGWAHVVVSYRVQADNNDCDFVVAVNGEVHGRAGISYDPRPRDVSRPFSIEYNGEGRNNGYYIANVRGYAEFLKSEDMSKALQARVGIYLSQLENPTRLEGQRPQLVNADHTMVNVTQKPGRLDEKLLTEVPKSVVKVMRGPFVNDDVWFSHEKDVTKRNVIIKFGDGYRIAKVVYDTHGTGKANGLFQPRFKLALGYSGWGDQKLWNPIAIKEGLHKGGVFTFYPDVPARYFKVYDTSTATDQGKQVPDTWFVNIEGIHIYAMTDPNHKRRGPNAYGEQTDENGQFVRTAYLLD